MDCVHNRHSCFSFDEYHNIHGKLRALDLRGRIQKKIKCMPMESNRANMGSESHGTT